MAKQKMAIGKPRRAMPVTPDLYVKVSGEYRDVFAKASIRAKAGEYQYLVWRDGEQVRNFYLGRKRKL